MKELTAHEASTYLSLTKHRLYLLCRQGKIPYRKSGKRYYFSKSELAGWALTIPSIKLNKEDAE